MHNLHAPVPLNLMCCGLPQALLVFGNKNKFWRVRKFQKPRSGAMQAATAVTVLLANILTLAAVHTAHAKVETDIRRTCRAGEPCEKYDLTRPADHDDELCAKALKHSWNITAWSSWTCEAGCGKTTRSRARSVSLLRMRHVNFVRALAFAHPIKLSMCRQGIHCLCAAQVKCLQQPDLAEVDETQWCVSALSR